MKKLINILVEITVDVINNFTYFIKNNLITFANVLNLILPYVMYFVAKHVAFDRNDYSIGGEIFIPSIFVIVIYYINIVII